MNNENDKASDINKHVFEAELKPSFYARPAFGVKTSFAEVYKNEQDHLLKATLKREKEKGEQFDLASQEEFNRYTIQERKRLKAIEESRVNLEKSSKSLVDKLNQTKSSYPPDILEEGADLFRQRNALYSNSYEIQGQVMSALFPNGVVSKTVKDHNRLTVFSTIISKLIRYTRDFEKGHEDSIKDIMVYAAILQELDSK